MAARLFRGYADGPFGQVHYHRAIPAEGGVPTLVLCHQSPMSARQFDRVLPHLAQAGVHTVAIDYPGFGQSDPPPAPSSVADFASVIPYVLDALGIEAAHVGGHHTGAMVSGEAAVTFPDRVKSIVLAGPVPLSQEERQDYIDRVLKEEIEFKPKPDGSHFIDLFKTRYKWVKDEPDGAELCTSYVVQNLMGLGPFWYGHNAAFGYDSLPVLKKVEQPALIIINSGDGLYAHAQITRKACPSFEYVELDGGGIDIVDQQPKAWAEAVAAFIHKTDAASTDVQPD